MKKQDLVPHTEFYQLPKFRSYKNDNDIQGEIDKTKPYYKLKVLSKIEGMTYEMLNTERQLHHRDRNAVKTYETAIELCDLIVEECVNDALKPSDLNHGDCYNLMMMCIATNMIGDDEEKK